MRNTQKMTKIGLSLLMLVSLIFQSINGVYAKNVTLDRETSMSSYLTVKAHTDNLGAYHEEQGKRVFKIDGQYAYCIESDVGLSNDKIYQDGQNAQDILSSKPNNRTTWKQKYDMLSALLSMVPTSISQNNKSEHIQWLVAQTMIWEITAEERGVGFTYLGNNRQGSMAYRDTYMWDNSQDQSDFQKYYQQLESQMLKYWKIPSFMSTVENEKKVTLDHWDGTYYYTTLTDTQGVLDNYLFSGKNLIIEKNQQTLVIKSTSLAVSSFTATLKPTFQIKAPIFWSDGNFQRTMTSGQLENASLKAYAMVEVGDGNLEVIKNDCFQRPLQGSVFQITSPSGKVSTHTTNEQGKITLSHIESGTYKIQEKSSPNGYLLNQTTFSVQVYPNQTASQVVTNEEPMGTISLKKSIDSTMTDSYLGDAYLKDNEYSLYAREKITNKAGTKVYFEKDQLITKEITNEKGEITFLNLHLGEYYLKETKSNSSLLLNPKIINVSITYKDMNTSLVVENVKVSNQVNSQRIQIFKQGESTGSAGVVSGLQGAEFTFVLKSEYDRVGFDKAHKYFVGTTDAKGFLTTPLLPYGTYRVKETKTPEGYYGASDFLVTIDKDTSEYEIGYQIQKVSVNNLPFESLLKIVKKDTATGKTVQLAGATFKIKNLDTNEYVSYIDWSAFPNIVVDQWTTHKDGTVTLNTKLKSGHYQLEEIKAPDGYVLNSEALKFDITQDHYEISDDHVTPLTVVEFKDQPILGKLTVQKKGEVLVDYQDGQFIYEERGLAHAKFGLYAREDILDPSGDGTVLYHQGELIETLETQKDGKITSSALPLGNYECREQEAPYGYVLNKESFYFSLTASKQDVDIVYEKEEIVNERQKVSVFVSKKDEGTLQEIAGAEISLIVNRDIYNIDGKVIVKAGTVLETVISSNNGAMTFKSDLPLDLTSLDHITDSDSLFVLKETKQPDGYLSKDVHYYMNPSYTNAKEAVISFHYDFLNKQTQTVIHKVDSNTKQNIAGAKIQIIDPLTLQVIGEWTSTQEGYTIKGLIVNKTYILHEVSAPTGYMIASDEEFMIQDIDGLQSIFFNNTLAPIKTLGDEPEIVKTEDYTILLSYLLMGIGAIAIFAVLFKKDKEE